MDIKYEEISEGLYYNAQYGLYITEEQLLKLKKQKKCATVENVTEKGDSMEENIVQKQK